MGLVALLSGKAQAGSYEVQVRIDGIVADVKAGVGFENDAMKLRLAARNRLLANYTGNVDGMTFLDGYVGGFKGFYAIGQARFFYAGTDEGALLTLYPQVGLFYSNMSNKQGGVNVWLTSSVAEEPVLELKIDPKYNPGSAKWYVPAQIDGEIFIWAPTLEPWNVSKERVRINVGYQPLEGLLLGPTVELEHMSETFSVKPGFFARAEL
jgi:hypothetical protein